MKLVGRTCRALYAAPCYERARCASGPATAHEYARAAGIELRDLVFNQVVHAGSGMVPAASALLREIRVEKLSIRDIRAAEIEKADQSVLGMSFLSRLKSFQLRQGTLTLDW